MNKPSLTPSNVSQAQQQEIIDGMSDAIKDRAGATYLAASAESVLGTHILPQAYAPYMEQLLVDCGDTADPIERMLVEQIALAHHNIGRLHVQAARAETIQQGNAYNSAAARLLAEFRRSVLALKSYREPPTTKQVTVVQQQNVAENQQVAYVSNHRDATGESEKRCDIELRNSQQEVLTHAQKIESFTEPASRGSGKEEPIEAKRINASG